MDEVSVVLKTGGHCIQSAAKNELRRISLVILYTDDENVVSRLAAQFELLEDFLRDSDFSRLRASDERYAGITESVCILTRDENSRLGFRLKFAAP